MRPNDFASYLLAIGICNLLLYFALSIIMKVSGEGWSLPASPASALLLKGGTWTQPAWGSTGEKGSLSVRLPSAPLHPLSFEEGEASLFHYSSKPATSRPAPEPFCSLSMAHGTGSTSGHSWQESRSAQKG